MPSCWLFGNGKFCLMIDNTNAISIGQNLAIYWIRILINSLLDYIFFNILSGCKISKDQRPIIIYFINQMSFFFLLLLSVGGKCTGNFKADSQVHKSVSILTFLSPKLHFCMINYFFSRHLIIASINR